MGETFVLLHGAWQAGFHLEEVADNLRRKGHIVFCPTLLGNREGDDKSIIGLEDAASSIIEFFEEHELSDVRLVAHSYAGMPTSAVAGRLESRLKRLVYMNAFVPVDGESLTDLIPPDNAKTFAAIAAANNNSLMLPFPVWREAFIGDVDIDRAKETYVGLNAQPFSTFTDKISLPRPLAELSVGKSYLHMRQDLAVPQSLPWHPRLSERLGLYRLIQIDGSHETMLSHPNRLADAIWMAARD